MCGRDEKRRKLLKTIDPEGHYKSKALLPFVGKRLIDWQLEALRQSPYVGEIFLVGLSEADVKFDYPVEYIPVKTESDIADKFIAGVDYLEAQGKNPDLIVISTSDAPGIQPEDINLFFEKVVELNDAEVILSLVPEDVLESAFPGSSRVVIRLKDHHLIPGELYALSPRAIRIGKPVISQLSQRRREINRQKKNISVGPVIRMLAQNPALWPVIIKYLLGTATLANAERAFSKAYDCKSRAVIIADAGFGMDMDLPEDYERLAEFVEQKKIVQGI